VENNKFRNSSIKNNKFKKINLKFRQNNRASLNGQIIVLSLAQTDIYFY
jgi:hypothetical protein